MALWNNFPSVDTHELNLDWIIRQMKDLIKEWESVNSAVSAEAVDADAAAASVTGNLLEGLRFHFELPRGPEGPEGPQGPSGNDFVILGLYSTLAALQSAHPTGSAGDAYAVGDADDNTVYIWSVDTNSWTDVGSIRGPKGDQGVQGVQGVQGDVGPYFLPSVDINGIISWSNNGGLENPASRDITGPTGATGAQGPTGPQGPHGVGLEILDLYATLTDLKADHATGTEGDCYAVGTAGSNTLYIWSDSVSDWVELGPLNQMTNQTGTLTGIGSTTINRQSLYKCGNIVHLYARVRPGADFLITGGRFLTVPIGYRPAGPADRIIFTTMTQWTETTDDNLNYYWTRGDSVDVAINTNGHVLINPGYDGTKIYTLDVVYITA